MTSAPVKNPVDILYVARKDSTASPKGDGNFAGNLRSAVEKNGQNTSKSAGPEKDRQAAGKKEDAGADQKKFDGTGSKRLKPSESAQNGTAHAEKPLPDDKSDAVYERIGGLMKRIGEMTGADEEQVLRAMENLGITGAALFVPENMTDLLMELTGTEDPVELVTNGDLFSSLQDLNLQASDLMEQLQDSFGLTPEELQGVLEQAQGVQPGQKETPETAQTVQEYISVPAEGAEEPGKDPEPAAEVDGAADVSEAADPNSVKEENNAFSEEQSADSRSSAFGETEASKEESSGGVSGKERKTDGHQPRVVQNDTHSASQTIQDPASRINQNELHAVQEETPVSYTERTAEAQRIADQIMDHMRVQLKQGVTELEMQLHPASLGNVNVSLVSREGNITAQFTAQNEAVKNVIEAQIVQLREQFEEQGIKVEAVEVAVADHQFEHRDDGSEQRNPQKSGSGAKRTRRINLEALSDEEISRLTEDADKIQADMMSRNGNTLDYTV